MTRLGFLMRERVCGHGCLRMMAITSRQMSPPPPPGRRVPHFFLWVGRSPSDPSHASARLHALRIMLRGLRSPPRDAPPSPSPPASEAAEPDEFGDCGGFEFGRGAGAGAGGFLASPGGADSEMRCECGAQKHVSSPLDTPLSLDLPGRAAWTRSSWLHCE